MPSVDGFPEAIAWIYPHTEVQLCIVHQIQNSLRYVASKNQKAFMVDLKSVYCAKTFSIEVVHRQFRKLAKTRGGFPNDDSLLKLLFTGIQSASKKMDHADPELDALDAALEI